VTRLAVIVPATNAPATLAACLEAVHAAHDPPDELIVFSDVAAPSPASARNAGVRRSTADILVFVDADVTIDPDALTRIRAAFEDDELAAVFGSYDDDPPAPGAVSGFRNLLHHHVHHESRGDVSTFWAGLGAVRRVWFDAIGGFVEHPVEDIEFGMRLHAAGAKIRLDPSIQGAHLKRWTLTGMVATDVFVRGAPWVGLLLRHRSSAVGLNLGWRHRLSALASLALVTAAALAAVLGVIVPVTVAATALAALVALNVSFYRLLLRRRGAAQAAAGIALHVLHHLASVAALVLGVAMYVTRSRASADPVDAPAAESPTA
jgi:hypothetical protein